MSTLYITEYADVRLLSGAVPAATEPEIGTQTVSIGASTQSNTLKSNTRLVRLHTDAICSVVFGINPTATTANRRMSAGQTEYFTISDGSLGSLKVAVISNT